METVKRMGTVSGARGDGTRADVSTQIETLQADMSALAGKIGDAAKVQVTELQSVAAEKTDDFRHVVRNNPMQAALISVGVGFMIGLLVNR